MSNAVHFDALRAGRCGSPQLEHVSAQRMVRNTVGQCVIMYSDVMKVDGLIAQSPLISSPVSYKAYT
ncbi:hypothetical protein EVAR_56743_1 [Eumeta japonica]|uniref:Uncharacterized protein n=1 Tax=Eumeta variegata TaxID=151549 RepID=A0A4C1ZP03_EUMVA|nr:hypothetical protein EVAR_56743_1 [Eumeta japonica]